MTLGERMGMLEDEVSTKGQALSDAVDEVFRAANDAFYGLPLWQLFRTPTYTKFEKAEDCIYE